MESARKKIKDIQEAEEFLEGIPQFSGEETGFRYGVDRARLLLEYAGNPHRELKIIHVAGSNGKGSVCALLDAALQAAGFKTGLFTSPHLTDIRERIRFCSDMIGEDDFVRLLNKVTEAADKARERYQELVPAYFDYLFVIAMLYYAEKKTDVVIIETGLGGRLDATNVCEKPVLSVITPVSLEHTAILGSTIEEIAFEKGGIIKPGVTAVVTDEDESVLKVFNDRAKKAGSRLVVFRKEHIRINTINADNIDFSLHNEYYRNVTVSIPIPALYEAENAGQALTALGVLSENGALPGFDKDRLSESLRDILNSFSVFEWPGRMERVGEGIYVDGAHNKAGIKAFVESVNAFAHDKENVLLFAVSDDKEKEEMVRLLCESRLFSAVVVTAFSGVRSADAERIATIFRKYSQAEVTMIEDSKEAYSAALTRPHHYVFCTGSLYLVGEIVH